jgi:hypothetical protein
MKREAQHWHSQPKKSAHDHPLTAAPQTAYWHPELWKQKSLVCCGVDKGFCEDPCLKSFCSYAVARDSI